MPPLAHLSGRNQYAPKATKQSSAKRCPASSRGRPCQRPVCTVPLCAPCSMFRQAETDPRFQQPSLATPRRAKAGGGEGSRTPVPDNQTGRDYMLSRKLVSTTGTPSNTLPRRPASMRFSRAVARRLRPNPCLLWRSSGVAGVHRRTSQPLRPREPTRC